MKRIIAAGLIALIAAPAFAQTTTTVQEVTTKGIIMEAQGMQIDVTYKPDGTFTAMDGAVTGKWRIDGDKICSSSNFNPAEECTAYPAGKKSGDSFDLTGAMGTAKITIK
ncbi:MAG: hypothetical protein B7Y90_11800 [Alphaproteobacteria bacterium 32-64-14]|nr:MAG: hypothetical protein B7Y90_11800 [Alphaproteobacteria bacterium 32-64-14]